MYELMVLVVSPFENINVWINDVSSESLWKD